MRYYLDTSAVYEMKRLPKAILTSSFYSVFSVVEIIAGLYQRTFSRRKAAISNLLNAGIDCNYTFPEQFIFRSFDFFNNYDFKEERTGDLFSLADELKNATSLEEFIESDQRKMRKYPFEYFFDLDQTYSKGFVAAAEVGKSQIGTGLKGGNEDNTLTLNYEIHQLDSRRKIVDFLSKGLLNDSITIYALANSSIMISGEPNTDKIHQEVYESYNGSLSKYLQGYSNYSAKKIANDSLPDRNDAQDLSHLIYLGKEADTKILSNDTFFAKAVPENFMTIDEALLQTLGGMLGVKTEPICVSYNPANWAKENECFPNVLEQVRLHGGQCVYGWQVWKLPYMLEAEFHAVWKSPEGEHVDITPNTVLNKPSRQFWVDTQKTFEGKQISNIRINTSSNGLVDDLIALQNFRFFLENKGDNAFRFDTKQLNDGEIAGWNFAKEMIGHVQTMINSKSRHDSECFCRTGDPYNQCHGQNLINGLKQMEVKIRSYS